MDYEGWKRILEPLSLMFTGACAYVSFQRAYRSIKGLPPCDPDEADKVILAGINELKESLARFDSRLSEVEKIAKPNTGK